MLEAKKNLYNIMTTVNKIIIGLNAGINILFGFRRT